MNDALGMNNNLDPVRFEAKTGVVVLEIDPDLRAHREGIAVDHELLIACRGFGADHPHFDSCIGLK